MTAVAFLLSGCGGTVIESSSERQAPQDFSKAALGYYLPKAVIPIAVEVKGNAVAVAYDPIPKLVPDTRYGPYYLYYNHQGLSTETVAISVGRNGLLQKVSSTSAGQTAEAIKGVNDIITQAAAFRAATKALVSPPDAEKAPPPPCDGMSAVFTLEIGPNDTIIDPKNNKAEQDKCMIRITPALRTAGHAPLLANAEHARASFDDQCKGMVCFRVQKAYTFGATVTVTGPSGYVGKTTIEEFTLMAPDPALVGFIKFDRGVFASRSATAEFSDGVLTSFSASNASELVGFLAVPAAALTTATLIRKWD